ncbi:LysR family transcriptional regulator [Bordetella hinzii]|uniref:LysR family transcriptional regulator n=1 Tax=Bordetella hinzii TaxID=103855 RepID=UPI00114F231A|nr:LysR family transcriptional regulator [Bordetella hinzii]QDJ51233.1 LysR family transcriptional regulator [Bordetella hinzii]
MTTPPPAAAGTDRMLLIETFVRIVEAGSLSAAAAQMDATQPTVSRRLQALERTLGARLLKRSTHAIALTEDGQRCYARARELLESWQSFESETRCAGEEPAGMLRVVAPHIFGQQHFMEPLAGYLRKYPNVRVDWQLHDRMPDLIAENVDCALRVGAVTDPSVVAIRLGEVPRTVVAAPALLPRGAVPAHPDELARLPWLALSTFYRNEISLTHVRTGETVRLSIQPRLSTDGLLALRRAVLLGLGLGAGSSWAMAEDLARGRLVEVAPEWRAAPLPLSLIYAPARFQPARLRRFIDHMRVSIPALLAGLDPPSAQGE